VESDDHNGPIEFLDLPAVRAPVPATKEEEEEERAPIAQYCEQEEGKWKHTHTLRICSIGEVTSVWLKAH
jgi:hypothetical protein